MRGYGRYTLGNKGDHGILSWIDIDGHMEKWIRKAKIFFGKIWKIRASQQGRLSMERILLEVGLPWYTTWDFPLKVQPPY